MLAATINGAEFSGFFSNILHTAEGAVKKVGSSVESAAKFVAKPIAGLMAHPPGWFAVAFPLLTSGSQRWWASKVLGKKGGQLYDMAQGAVVSHVLGPAGAPALAAYNSVLEAASKGDLNAKEILSKMPQIGHVVNAAKGASSPAHAELLAQNMAHMLAPTAAQTAAGFGGSNTPSHKHVAAWIIGGFAVVAAVGGFAAGRR